MRMAPKAETLGLEAAKQGLWGPLNHPGHFSVSLHLWAHPLPPPLPHQGFRLSTTWLCIMALWLFPAS